MISNFPVAFWRNRLAAIIWLGFLLGSVTVVCGCSDGRLPTYPVQGTVRFEDGRAIRVGTVEFRAIDGGHTARGRIGSDGRFTLSTFRDNDGAVAGMHQVIVLQHFDPAVWKTAHEDPEHYEFVISRRYADYDASGLTATVKPQSSNQIELVVGKPAKPRDAATKR
jgi:hypothetical protein